MVDADQWDVQATLQRFNESLIARGYRTWFDITHMKGSTVDAMGEAIDGAEVMLYGVSLQYKESANVRNTAIDFLLCFFRWLTAICVRGCCYHSADWRLTTPTSKSWT